jgi:hypothetical protein
MRPGVTMSELDHFLTPTLARQTEAEQALVNGDPGPRLAMTSINDPVTVFGVKVPVRADGTRSARPSAGSPRVRQFAKQISPQSTGQRQLS